MSYEVGSDSDGHQQIVWLQEKSDSCGPACVYMIECMRASACLLGGEQRVRYLTSLLPQGYTEGSGTASFQALSGVLGKVGILSVAINSGAPSAFFNSAKYPFIARVAWPNGGGHFVVCAAKTSRGTIVCLDPWYGLNETSASALPVYSAGDDARAGVCLVRPVGGRFSGHFIQIIGP